MVNRPHPDLPEMVKYARESGTADIIEIFQCSKLEPTLNQGRVDGGLQRINISLEGLSDERYLEVAGVKQNTRSSTECATSMNGKQPLTVI